MKKLIAFAGIVCIILVFFVTREAKFTQDILKLETMEKKVDDRLPGVVYQQYPVGLASPTRITTFTFQLFELYKTDSLPLKADHYIFYLGRFFPVIMPYIAQDISYFSYEPEEFEIEGQQARGRLCDLIPNAIDALHYKDGMFYMSAHTATLLHSYEQFYSPRAK